MKKKKNNLSWSNLLQSILAVAILIGLSCKAGQAANATLPVAPTQQNFMWQTLQEKFLDETGEQCSQKIALAVSDHATCYAAPSGNLRCDGSIYTQQYNFAASTGITNVDQIMLSPTFNAVDGNGICVHKTDGTAWCLGSGISANSWGQFGTGTSGTGYAQFVQWGDRHDIARIGTGTWDQMCSLTISGDVYCSGYNFGPSPVLVGTGTSFYVTTFGTVDINPISPPVDRASPGRTECTISGGNLNCMGQTFSSTSPVVDGGPRQCDSLNPQQCKLFRYDVCLLNSGGTVQCFGAQAGQYFGTGEVLTLATNGYTKQICAVKRDGSIWCTNGGPGSELAVQPPGSVTTACLSPITATPTLGVAILVGVPVDFSVTVADPSKVQSVQWDFNGDGTVDQTTTTLTTQFTYPTAGNFTAMVTVINTDGGNASYTTLVTVQSPTQAIATANKLVQQLPLNRGQKTSLTSKLNAVAGYISQGDIADACSTLVAEINEANALVNSGTLSAKSAALLLGEVHAIQRSLGCL